MYKDNSRKHIFMVQSRDAKALVAEKIEDGREDLINGEWEDSLTKPVWLQRAVYIANRMESKYTETRIIEVA